MRTDHEPIVVTVCGRRISLGDIQRATGISRPHLSRIMRGDRRPSFRYANRIAAYLGLSLDDLYGFLVERMERE